nr:uncharacterized protein LOC132765855 [Anolis sagrei ordinatus]
MQASKQNNQRTFSGPTMTIISINIEGMSAAKEQLLYELCRDKKCDVLCVQETHRDERQKRPKVPGMVLVAERPHAQYGSAVFVKPGLQVSSAHNTEENNIEVLTVELNNITITSVYKPPNEDFCFSSPENFDRHQRAVVIGDFNSHSHVWGYAQEDRNGEAVLSWSELHKLSLIHDSKLPPSYNSGRWHRGYNPDLLFVSDSIVQQCTKSVGPPIPNTQHRPIICQLFPTIRPQEVRFKRRYNFRKADWTKFSDMLDDMITSVAPIPEEYEHFIEIVKTCSRASIPRGCRTNYLQGITPETAALLENYYRLHNEDPFSEQTLQAAQSIVSSISEAKKEQWIKLITEVDMGRSSQKAWRLLRRLSNDPSQTNTHANIKADQIAHQLLKNGKPNLATKVGKKPIARQPEIENNNLHEPFTSTELDMALNKCKNGKAAGLDDLRMEQIKNFGPKARRWLLELMNNCTASCQIPKIWRKARVIAILKPSKDRNDPKSDSRRLWRKPLLDALSGAQSQLHWQGTLKETPPNGLPGPKRGP